MALKTSHGHDRASLCLALNTKKKCSKLDRSKLHLKLIKSELDMIKYDKLSNTT